MSLETAITATVALERGIEAAFQLEDSELSSEGLPDPDQRGRALFVESAEGGAGALRRLVDDPAALPKAARTALQIMHFDPGTGDDLSINEPGRERCVRACYDCLLSYGNQRMHEMINRHLVRDLMLEARHRHGVPARRSHDGSPGNQRTAESRGLPSSWPGSEHTTCGCPTRWTIEAEGARPDLTYRLPDGNAAVFVKGTEEDSEEPDGRDERAQDVLRDLGWSVIIIGAGADWAAVAARYPSVFGTQ